MPLLGGAAATPPCLFLPADTHCLLCGTTVSATMQPCARAPGHTTSSTKRSHTSSSRPPRKQAPTAEGEGLSPSSDDRLPDLAPNGGYLDHKVTVVTGPPSRRDTTHVTHLLHEPFASRLSWWRADHPRQLFQPCSLPSFSSFSTDLGTCPSTTSLASCSGLCMFHVRFPCWKQK